VYLNKTNKMKKNRFLLIGGIIFLIGLVGVCIASPKQDRRFNITLTDQEVGIVIQGLQELPIKTAGNTLNSILTQLQVQAQAPAKLPKQDSTTNKKKP
jgi:hypothetical protein